MATWEYATVPLLAHNTKQILDMWGEDGWELVQVVPGPQSQSFGSQTPSSQGQSNQSLVAYLKRPREHEGK